MCPTLCNPMNCSPPGSSIHGIVQARVLEWVAISFSRGSSQPRDQTRVSCTAGRFFTDWATREALLKPNTNQRLRFDQHPRASLAAQAVKNLPAMQETWVWSLSREGPWGIPWTQKPGFYRGSLFVMLGSQRVGHDCATNTFTFTLNTLHIPQMTRRKENSKIREKNSEN